MKAALYFSVFITVIIGLIATALVYVVITGRSSNANDSLSTIYPALPFFIIFFLFAICFKKRLKALIAINIVYFILPFIMIKLLPNDFSASFLIFHLIVATIYLTIIIVNYSKLR